MPTLARRGRGAVSNRAGRFEGSDREAFDDGWGSLNEPLADLVTELTAERTRTIIANNDSPDIPFEQSINPYKGCEHGCIYCFARPTHAYIGLSPGQDFESKIRYKPEGPAALLRELGAKRYVPKVIAIGANTDPYQPAERTLRLTRKLIEVLAEHRHPFSIVTKSASVLRDIDLLAPLAKDRLVNVFLSITSLQPKLARKLEPRAAAPHRRLDVVEKLSAAGIPVGVLVSPIIPALNDHEVEAILAAVAERGARSATYILIRLPLEIKELFAEWLENHYPDRKERVLGGIRQTRSGKLYDSTFGKRRGSGPYADLLAQRFDIARRRHGLENPLPPLDIKQFRKPGASRQLTLL